MPDTLPWDHFTNQTPLSSLSSEPVIVIGAGLAGCWCARTLAEAGVNVVVLEAGTSAAAGASSNPAGIVKPFVTRSPSHAMSFYVEAHRYLLARLADWKLAEPCQYQECGVVQLAEKAYPESEHYAAVSPLQMSDTLGVQSSSHGLLFETSGWLNPSTLCHSLLQHERISLRCRSSVSAIEPCCRSSVSVNEPCEGQQTEGNNGQQSKINKGHQSEGIRWRVTIRHEALTGVAIKDEVLTGEAIMDEAIKEKDKSRSHTALETSHLVIATGAVLNKLPLTSHLTSIPARGQISRFNLASASHGKLKRVVSGTHYIIPDGNTVVAGASFERGVTNNQVKDDDDQANKAGAEITLSSLQIEGKPIESFAGVRATTPDRLPLVGPLPDKDACDRAYADLRHGRPLANYELLPVHTGVFVLGGLGSRGIVTAPFASRLLIDYMMGNSDILNWSSLINPARFQVRRLKRGQSG